MSKRVAIAIIENSRGDILFGLRDDCKKWSAPGGHIDKGESPEEGLFREVKEETGLDISEAKLIAVKEEDGVTGYIYKVRVTGKQDFSKDPDKEFIQLQYKDIWDIRKDLYFPWKENWIAKYWAGLI